MQESFKSCGRNSPKLLLQNISGQSNMEATKTPAKIVGTIKNKNEPYNAGKFNTIGYGVQSPYNQQERAPSFTIKRDGTALQSKLQTHFAVYKFVARHNDEMNLNIGDAIHVSQTYDDLWFEGTNLKTGEHGVFPSRYVSDILSCTGQHFEFSEYGVQFFLRFLGSVEVYEFKGNNVLCQAISEVLNARKGGKLSDRAPCSLEIDQQGIRLIDHAQEYEKRQTKSLMGRLFNNDQKAPQARYFFKLKDVTFCGCYPNSPRYFGFVTKHATQHRFACHILMSEFSTEPVAKAIGKAFSQFYIKYIGRSSSR